MGETVSCCRFSVPEPFGSSSGRTCNGPPSYSNKTFWSFAGELLRRSGGKGGSRRAALIFGHASDRLAGDRGTRLFRAVASRRTAPRVPAVGDQAAASMDGHVPQVADGLASARALRAATAGAVRSAGTASPLPKYISSGVCPRNTEWGSTRLCSWT